MCCVTMGCGEGWLEICEPAYHDILDDRMREESLDDQVEVWVIGENSNRLAT